MPVSETTDPGGTIHVPPEGLPFEEHEQELVALLAGDPRVSRPLVPPARLQARIAQLARDIRAAHLTAHSPSDAIHLAVVLTGAFRFAQTLGEALFALDGAAVRYHFLKAVTYGSEIKARGEARREVTLQWAMEGLSGQDVILVDDLVDQGFTLAALRRHLLEEAGARLVRTCVLLEKRLDTPTEEVRSLRASLSLDYVGFTVPDLWVAGFGIDAAEDFRNLPFIITVNEDHYRDG